MKNLSFLEGRKVGKRLGERRLLVKKDSYEEGERVVGGKEGGS